MKKLAVLLSVVLILSFAFSGIAFTKTYTLGLCLSTLNNPFFVTLKNGAESAAKNLGVKLIVYDAQDDPAKQASQVEDLIQKKVDAILVNPTDANAIVPSVLKANKVGIPVFTIDRSAAKGDVVCHIASDNVAGGRMAGEYLAKLLNYKGNVAELVGIPGTSAARDRGKGFNEVMKKYKDIKIVARQTADFNRAKGMQVFENILQAHPEVQGVFAHNDEMVLGAIAAAEAAGRNDIIFVGFDAIDDAVKAVKAGKLAATVAQQPAEMGKLGVENAVKYLKGGKLPKFIPVPLKLITKDNVK